MEHLAIIQKEFVKEARKWDDLTLDEQRTYIKKHPGSKRRLTGKSHKFHKFNGGHKVMFTKDKLNAGSIHTIPWQDLKNMLENKGDMGVVGFKLTKDGIDVFHDKVLSVQEGRDLDKKLGLGRGRVWEQKVDND